MSTDLVFTTIPVPPNVSIRAFDASRTLRILYKELLLSYGPQSWWPSSSAFETIVGAYLVQNTSWRGVVNSIRNLSEAGFLSVEGLERISVEELRILIRPSGYMIRKAAALKTFAHFLSRQHHGSLAELASKPTVEVRTALLALPGVGPETADVILLYALGHPVVVVDEYLRRIAFRHGLSPQKHSYSELQQLVESAFHKDQPDSRLQHYNEFHALIVEAGKNHCGPKPRCTGCPLQKFLHQQADPASPSNSPAPERQD